MLRLFAFIILFLGSFNKAHALDKIQLDAAFQMVHAEGLLRSADITLIGIENLFSNDDIRSVDPLIIHSSLNRLVNRVPGLRALFTTDQNGILQTDSFKFPPRPLDLSDRDYIKTTLKQTPNSIFLGKPIQNLFFGFDSLPIARPIADNTSKIKGVAVAIMTPDHLIKREQVCEKCVVSIFKVNGDKITSFPSEISGQPEILNFISNTEMNTPTDIKINQLQTQSLWIKSEAYGFIILYSQFKD